MLNKQILEQINNMKIFTTGLFNNDNIENNIKAIVLSLIRKLDLVTREEFDTQQKVLLATRAKLDELERKLNNQMVEK